MDDISRALKFTWNADLLKVRGALRLDDGDLAGVVHDADAMLKLNPQNADAFALRGAALARKKDYAARSARSRQGDRRRRQERAGLWRARPDLPRQARQRHARSPTSTTRSRSAPSARRRFWRAPSIYKAKGDTAKAIADLDAGDQARSAAGRALLRPRHAGEGAGKADDALADLDAALARAPDNVDWLMARADI